MGRPAASRARVRPPVRARHRMPAASQAYPVGYVSPPPRALPRARAPPCGRPRPMRYICPMRETLRDFMIAIGVAGALFATVQSHANGRALAHVTGELEATARTVTAHVNAPLHFPPPAPR